MAMASLQLWQEFSSWSELFDAVERYCSMTSQPFVKSSCKTCVQANKHVKGGQRAYPLDMEYVYYTFACTHGGSLKSCGLGKRHSKSGKQACEAKIYACLDRTDRTKIVIKQLNDVHNHEISADIFERYAKQRKLNDVEKKKAEEFVKLNISPKDVRREMVRLTGKRVIMQDVRNIKKAVRLKERQAASNSTNGKDAQILAVELERWRTKDPGLLTDFSFNEEKVLQYVFIQTTEMRHTFKKFAEHVLVDCTYCVNDRDMPLLSFLVVDGNSRSRLCGFALISNESSTMLSDVFSKFKEHNPQSSMIKTFMVDEDLNKVTILEEVFPDALCELCLFHVKKALKKQIDSLEAASSSLKMEIKGLVDKLCNSESSHQYDELKEQLLTLHQPFSQYFLDNWDSMRVRWVHYARAEHVNFGDSTNNRIESYHQKLKSHIPSPLPLNICIEKILFLYECLLEETAHLNFVNVTKKSSSQFPEIQKHITPHALKLAVSEFHKAVNYVVRDVDSISYVWLKDDTNNNHKVEGMSCTCHTATSLLLPCRHIIAVRRDKGEEPLTPSLFHKRWHIQYNKCHVQQQPATDAFQSPSVSLDWRSCAKEKRNRYGLVKRQTDRLLHHLVELDDDSLRYYLDQLQVFEEKVSQCKRFSLVDSEGEDTVVDDGECYEMKSEETELGEEEEEEEGGTDGAVDDSVTEVVEKQGDVDDRVVMVMKVGKL